MSGPKHCRIFLVKHFLMAAIIMCFNVLALSACPAGTLMALLCSQELKKSGASMAGDFLVIAVVTKFLVGGCESSCWKAIVVIYKHFFLPKETPTAALYYSNLVIYTNKPFVSNLICYCLNLQSTYSITITLSLVVLVTV